MNKILYLFLFATLFFAACSSDDIPNEKPDGDKQIELRFSVKNFQGESMTRADFDATPAEEQIDNLCVFIQSGTTWRKYYIDGPTFSDGTWDKTNDKILLGLTASDVGTNDNVYVVANAGDITGSITSVSDLNSEKIETENPWSDNIKVPLIMSGSKLNYDFKNNPVLDAVPLTRAVAKVEIEVTLSPQYQSEPTITNPNNSSDIRDQYKYQLLNFDKQTYLFKPTGTKPDDLVSQPAATWTKWDANFGDKLSAYTLTGTKVTTLKFVTYVNERDAGDATTINVILPYWDEGMPPPQFMDDPLPIKLPTKIERNHYYKVAVQM